MDEHSGYLQSQSYMRLARQAREHSATASAHGELESVGVYLRDALIYKDAANSALSSNQQSQTQNPRSELSNLISESKFEEAFTNALQRSDPSLIFWLCSEVSVVGIMSKFPVPLSQAVLLNLLQQLALDLRYDTCQKFNWITHLAAAIDPMDPMIALHVKVVFESLYRLCCCPSIVGPQVPSTSHRLLQHVINSILMKIPK